MTDSTTPITRRPASVDAEALAGWLAEDRPPRLLDVRTPAEFATAHVPGSYNVPLDLLREHRTELGAHLDDEVVLVCRSGARATQAEELLASTGTSLPQLHVLTGGAAAWEASGAPMIRGAGRWELERQVRLVAGGIVLLAVLASVVLPWAKWLAAGIGAGLTVAAVTNSCAMGMMLSALPYNRRPGPSITDVLTELSTPVSRDDGARGETGA